MQNFLWRAALTVSAGVSVLIQQALNANLRSELDSAAWSDFMSYFLGIVCMVLLATALRDPVPSVATISRVPLWAWSGGIFGALFIGFSRTTWLKLDVSSMRNTLLEKLRSAGAPTHEAEAALRTYASSLMHLLAHDRKLKEEAE